MFKTNGGTIKRWLSELEGAGLIAVAIDGSAFEAYPVGSLLRCKALSKTRLVIARTLFDDHANCARTLCWDELNSTGTVDLQLLEKTHSKPSTLTQHRSNVVPKAEAEAEATPTELEGFAPATQAPPAPPSRARGVSRVMTPPTPDEVQDYAAEYGETIATAIDGLFGAKFCAHYGGIGWKVGKVPIESWQSIAARWVINDKDKSPLRRGARNPRSGDAERRAAKPKAPAPTIPEGWT
jgi:hypothetical protein